MELEQLITNAVVAVLALLLGIFSGKKTKK